MGPHEEAVGYLLSKDLKWSRGAVSGQAIVLNNELRDLPIERLVPRLRELGYAGIWIDRLAYEDRGATLLAELSKRTGSTMTQSSDAHYAFFRL